MLTEDDKVLHCTRYGIRYGFMEEDVDLGCFVYYDDAVQKVNELVAYIENLEGKLSKYEEEV